MSTRRLSPALFVLGLALAAAALHQAQQTVRSHRRTSERLVRDYGAFAAWSYRQHAAEALRQHFRAAFVPVVHATPEAPVLGAITANAWRARLMEDGALPECGDGCRPRIHFRIPLDDAAAGEFAGDAVPDDERRWIAATVLRHATGPERPTGDFGTVRASDAGRVRFLVYAVVERDVGTRGAGGRVAYGFEFDPARHAPLFGALFATRQLLPTVVTESRPNERLLGVQVRAPGGPVYFASSDTGTWSRQSGESLGEQLGGLEVRAAIQQAAAAGLAGGTLPPARLPLIAGLLALAAGLTVVAVRQMRRDAELARMRGDFVSSVSHELRTPLAQVQLFLETLRLGRYRTDAQRDWILESMQRETTRLTTLVDNVLHFSRAERGAGGGGFGGVREPTAVDEYLQGVIASFAPLAVVRGVIIEARLEPGLVAPLHRESFRQVMLNLLDNAVKYGPKGQTIRVTSEGAGERIRIVVEDQGPGVEPREREAIFEPFRRGERAIGSVAVGSGIGLSVARDLVASHEGRIRVEAAPTGGARFVVELPGWREPARATAHGAAGAGTA